MLNRIPGLNAVAGLHDIFQISMPTELMRAVLNVPGMIPAVLITYGALLDGEAGIPLHLRFDRAPER